MKQNQRSLLSFLSLSLIVAAIVVMATSCGIVQSFSLDKLAGKWRIVSVNGEEIHSKDKEMIFTIDLDKQFIGGYGFCNSMGSAFAVTNEGLCTIEPMLSTRVGCPGNATEQAVSEAFTASKRILCKGPNKLLFYNNTKAAGAPTLVLVRTK